MHIAHTLHAHYEVRGFFALGHVVSFKVDLFKLVPAVSFKVDSYCFRHARRPVESAIATMPSFFFNALRRFGMVDEDIILGPLPLGDILIELGTPIPLSSNMARNLAWTRSCMDVTIERFLPSSVAVGSNATFKVSIGLML